MFTRCFAQQLGDVLVLDNAAIHHAAGVWDALDAIFAAAGITVLFLPVYSPELNPAELIFSQSKTLLSDPAFAPNFPLWVQIFCTYARAK